MKMNEKIILYVDGQLDINEQVKFEEELVASPDLQKQLRYYKNFLKGFEEISDPEVDGRYFNNIIPRFRERIEKKSYRKFRPVLVFSSAFSTVIIVFFVLLINKNITNDNLDYNTISFNNVNQSELNEYLVNSNDQILTNNIPVSMESQYDSIIEGAIYSELNILNNEQSMVNVLNKFDFNSIIATVDLQEANVIYADLINKKLY